MDATRSEDGRLVSLKTICRNPSELDVALSLTTPNLINHPMNHCVRILDTFVDALEPDRYFIVMPFLCPFDDPPFGAIGEVIDFVRQTLEVRSVWIKKYYTETNLNPDSQGSLFHS